MSKIPLFSVKTVNANIDCLSVIKRVVESHWYVLGKEVAGFEEEFASYLGLSSCISVANGTDALELALRALGIAQNDHVITVANAGFYSSTAIHMLGAIPYYVDIDLQTLTMSAEKLKEALVSVKPKAIIVTHLYGQLADIETICHIASDANVPIIEDCAQAHGAKRHGKYAGTFGEIGCFSFYPTKNLGALGDGGAIVTNNTSLAVRLKQLRQYGWDKKYHVNQTGGSNSRLDEIQAAILRVKLPYLDDGNTQRREIAKKYNMAFAKLPLSCPHFSGEEYVGHLYVVRTANRDSFRRYLETLGIATDVHYPIADQCQLAYQNPHIHPIHLPDTQEACQQVVSLPCYPGLTQTELNSVIKGVQQYFATSF